MRLFQLLNGLTFAALLFVVASGFTLIFGLLRIVNLAHGALYLFGGYIGYTVATRTGSFASAASARWQRLPRSVSCSIKACCASSAATSCARCC